MPSAVARSVLLVAIVLVLGALLWSPGATLSVALGSATALLHLWSVAHWVKRAFATETVRLTWVLFSFLKLAVLFLGLAWLARSQVVSMLPFLLGYSALPLGILVAQVFGPVWSVLSPPSGQSSKK